MKPAVALLIALCLPAFADEKPASPTPDTAQPAVETLDLATIARIRDEGMNHSHIMEYVADSRGELTIMDTFFLGALVILVIGLVVFLLASFRLERARNAQAESQKHSG